MIGKFFCNTLYILTVFDFSQWACGTFQILKKFLNIKKDSITSPEPYGSVSVVSSRRMKGRQFDSQSGHMPGLHVQSLDGIHTKGIQLIFLSHIDISVPLFLPPFPAL